MNVEKQKKKKQKTGDINYHGSRIFAIVGDINEKYNPTFMKHMTTDHPEKTHTFFLHLHKMKIQKKLKEIIK